MTNTHACESGISGDKCKKVATRVAAGNVRVCEACAPFVPGGVPQVMLDYPSQSASIHGEMNPKGFSFSTTK